VFFLYLSTPMTEGANASFGFLNTAFANGSFGWLNTAFANVLFGRLFDRC
jgi:hypothetical protein